MEVSLFQGVGIEEFHCIQKCPHIMRLRLYGSILWVSTFLSLFSVLVISSITHYTGVPHELTKLAIG